MAPKGRCERGVGKWTALVFGALTAATILAAYHIGPFFYYYFEIENQTASLIRVASTHTNQELRAKLMYHVNKMELPVEPDDIIIERQDNFMTISFSYDEVFFLSWKDKDYDLHTFHFDVLSEGQF